MTLATRYSVFLAVLFFCVHVQADDLLELHLEAMGGRQQLSKVETIHRSGTIEGDGALGKVSGTFEEAADLVKLFGYDASELSFGGFGYTRQTGWGKGASWRKDTNSGISDLLPAEAQVIAYQSAPSPLATIILTDSSAKVTHAGEAKFNGAQCDVLIVDGRAERFYLNQDSHLLEGLTVDGLMKTMLGDYEDVDGVQIPNKRVVVITAIDVKLNYKFENTELNKVVDQKRIEKPRARKRSKEISSDQVHGKITAEQVIGIMDKDDDEKIDLQEYLHAHREDPAGEVLNNFKSLDVNNDSLLDLDEAKRMARFANMKKDGSGQRKQAVVTAQQLVDMMDSNGDGKIAKDEAVEDVRVAFGSIDANADGFIDVSEAEVMAKYANQQSEAASVSDLQESPKPKDVTATMILGYMDTDGDNRISKDEANEETKPHFSYIDTNGDGFLDLNEVQAIADYMNNQ